MKLSIIDYRELLVTNTGYLIFMVYVYRVMNTQLIGDIGHLNIGNHKNMINLYYGIETRHHASVDYSMD